MAASDRDKVMKILFVGDSGVGKSSLFLRYMDGIVPNDTVPTVGEDVKHKTIELETTKRKVERVTLQVCDTAGQERFGTLTSSLYRLAQGILICYDSTDSETFNHVNNWRAEIMNYAPKDAQICLIATKTDLSTRRQISTEAGKNMADSWHVPFFEVSARTNANVDEAIAELARRITVARSLKQASPATKSRQASIVNSSTITKPQRTRCTIL